MTKEERIQQIIQSRSLCNIPHPNMPGYRIVGWVVEQDIAGLSEGTQAILEISHRLLKQQGDCSC